MDTPLISRDTVPTTDMRLSVIEAPRPAIPTEVVEQIINMVAESMNRISYTALEERTQSLHACALVARSWVPRSRLHLFCRIVLCSDLRTRRFLSSLTLSPALGRYVEILQISPNDKESYFEWIYKALFALPPLLPHLRELALCHLPVLHPAYFAALSRFHTVESLWLIGLRQQSLREIVQLISRFPQLRRLHVLDCRWKLPGRYYSGKQHNLTSLNVYSNFRDRDGQFLEWAVASGSTRTLTTFRAFPDVAGSAMDSVVQACYSTLQELHLKFWKDEEDKIEVPLFANHLALQRLALRGSLQDIISVLTHLPLFAPSSLIGICVDPWKSVTVRDFEEVPESQWKAIDPVLCNPKFPRLKSVAFTQSDEKPLKNPHALFQRVLPKSYECGILWLQCNYRGPCTRIAPVDAPQYAGPPFEWEDLYYP